MKIHADALTRDDLFEAARLAGVDFTALEDKGSRSRNFAWKVTLTGDSPRDQNFGGGDKAALWDQWGIFLAHLFANDPLMHTEYDESGEYFHWRTGNRFATLTRAIMCDHKWEYMGKCATGAYSVKSCKRGCGAVERRLLGGRTFADLALV